jgi:hypothetical protein
MKEEETKNGVDVRRTLNRINAESGNFNWCVDVASVDVTSVDVASHLSKTGNRVAVALRWNYCVVAWLHLHKCHDTSISLTCCVRYLCSCNGCGRRECWQCQLPAFGSMIRLTSTCHH